MNTGCVRERARGNLDAKVNVFGTVGVCVARAKPAMERERERKRETPTFDKSGLTSRAPRPPYPFTLLLRYSVRVDLGNAISRFWIAPRFFRLHRVPPFPKRVSLLIDNVVLDRKRVDANVSRLIVSSKLLLLLLRSSRIVRIVQMDSAAREGRINRINFFGGKARLTRD